MRPLSTVCVSLENAFAQNRTHVCCGLPSTVHRARFESLEWGFAAMSLRQTWRATGAEPASARGLVLRRLIFALYGVDRCDLTALRCLCHSAGPGGGPALARRAYAFVPGQIASRSLSFAGATRPPFGQAFCSASMMAPKSAAFSDAPPTSAPSTLATAKISVALDGLTEPP